MKKKINVILWDGCPIALDIVYQETVNYFGVFEKRRNYGSYIRIFHQRICPIVKRFEYGGHFEFGRSSESHESIATSL